jgi:flagellar biosynthesis protein FliQ
MDQEEIIELAQQSFIILLQISTPVMLIGLAVGVTVALFQALTQIQEITLVFVPKILAIMLSLFVLLPNMAAVLITFTEYLADKIVGIQ